MSKGSIRPPLGLWTESNGLIEATPKRATLATRQRDPAHPVVYVTTRGRIYYVRECPEHFAKIAFAAPSLLSMAAPLIRSVGSLVGSPPPTTSSFSRYGPREQPELLPHAPYSRVIDPPPFPPTPRNPLVPFPFPLHSLLTPSTDWAKQSTLHKIGADSIFGYDRCTLTYHIQHKGPDCPTKRYFPECICRVNNFFADLLRPKIDSRVPTALDSHMQVWQCTLF